MPERKHIQNVPYRYPEAADAGLTRALTRYDGNSGKIGSVRSGHKHIIPHSQRRIATLR